MLAYDVLSFDKSLDHHHVLSNQQVFEKIGKLGPDGLKGAATYYDCQTEYAERLSVENVLSAQENGAIIINYAKADRFILEGSTVKGVEFTDLLEGRPYTVRAPLVINVGGPWVDEVLKGVGKPIKRLIGGTKGSHFVIDPFPGAPKTAVYYEARSDGRAIMVMPWTGRYLVGSTDLFYKDDLDYVRMDDDEIDYLIKETNILFPFCRSLTRKDPLQLFGCPPAAVCRGEDNRSGHPEAHHPRSCSRRGRSGLDCWRQADHLPQPGRADRRLDFQEAGKKIAGLPNAEPGAAWGEERPGGISKAVPGDLRTAGGRLPFT